MLRIISHMSVPVCPLPKTLDLVGVGTGRSLQNCVLRYRTFPGWKGGSLKANPGKTQLPQERGQLGWASTSPVAERPGEKAQDTLCCTTGDSAGIAPGGNDGQSGFFQRLPD